ncbi:DUF418 domain-containing protein [Mucilaginibacter puniceus]
MVLLLFHNVSAKSALYLSLLTFLIFPASIVFLSGTNNPSETTPLQLFQSHNIINVFTYGLKESFKDFFALNKLFGLNLVVLACFFLGQYLQKVKFFDNLTQNKKYIKKSFWIGLLMSFISGVIYFNHDNLGLLLFKYYNIQYLFETFIMIFIASAICWLYVCKKLKTFFYSLQTIGRMTLTNYLMQNLIGLLLFSGFGFSLAQKLPFYGYVLIAIGIYICQIYYSIWWLSKYNYGPVEWLWRRLTYGNKIIIKKNQNI